MIHGPYQAFYIESMRFHTSSALKSLKLLQAIMTIFQEEGEVVAEYEGRFLESIHNIIHQAGCLSRYFFPSRDSKLHKERASYLRSYLEVTEESPLADRRLRDAMEHFDERLDRYLESGIVGHVLPKVVVAVYDDPEVPVHIFRGFVLDVGKFCLLNEWFEIESIIRELVRIASRLEAFANSGQVFKK
ncbi:hypothetical protein [Sandarakinorhabdus sp.]|uniref:hypothetical protein n=1 Tax=Sandarakinorhabdus sp. TaxID=1916663 RepID=UPI003F725395